jgi:hypothetical protein
VTRRERVRTARAMAKVMRVAGDEEGEDGKVMAMVTRMTGEWTVTARKSAMATCAICSTVASTHSNDFFKNGIS